MSVTGSRHTVRIQGIECSYTKDGDGSPIILLHGWAQSSRSWQSFVPFLRSHHSLYALDLPGFGLSDTPKSVWGIPEYATFVHAFSETVTLTKPNIIGHSFGARVALEHATHFSTEKLVVIATAGDQHTWFRYVNGLVVRVLKNITPAFLFRAHASHLTPKGYADASRIDKACARHMLDVYLKTHDSGFKTNFESILCPTLLVYGERDNIAPSAIGASLQKKIPHAKLVTIPNAGHFPFIDAPEGTAGAVTSFLRS